MHYGSLQVSNIVQYKSICSDDPLRLVATTFRRSIIGLACVLHVFKVLEGWKKKLFLGICNADRQAMIQIQNFQFWQKREVDL